MPPPRNLEKPKFARVQTQNACHNATGSRIGPSLYRDPESTVKISLKFDHRRACVGCRYRLRGFTIVELLVTLSIVALLMSLLMPGLRSAREGAQRMQCASNLRQVGVALFAYAFQHDDALPATIFDDTREEFEPGEMMAMTTGVVTPPGAQQSTPGNWDGLGRLIRFIDEPRVLFCPCHHGEHPWDRYADGIKGDDDARLYCNYHFLGDTIVSDDDADNGARRRLFQLDNRLVIVADGMRTPSDLNHNDGANTLGADGSVSYWYDHAFRMRDAFVASEADASPSDERYAEIWKMFSERDR
jgi:prepilin-type N-terminal cleavage/methylation domain-containing protein